jgi:hypothetical protein
MSNRGSSRKVASGKVWESARATNLVLFTPEHACGHTSRLKLRANLQSNGGVEEQQVLSQDIARKLPYQRHVLGMSWPRIGKFTKWTYNGQHLFARQQAALITSPADVGPKSLCGRFSMYARALGVLLCAMMKTHRRSQIVEGLIRGQRATPIERD